MKEQEEKIEKLDNAISIELSLFDEFLDISGCIDKGSMCHFELQGVIDGAVRTGMQYAGHSKHNFLVEELRKRVNSLRYNIAHILRDYVKENATEYNEFNRCTKEIFEDLKKIKDIEDDHQ